MATKHDDGSVTLTADEWAEWEIIKDKVVSIETTTALLAKLAPAPPDAGVARNDHSREMLAGFLPVVQAYIIAARTPGATNGQKLALFSIMAEATENTAKWLKETDPSPAAGGEGEGDGEGDGTG